ncbi:uncharacterized protein TA11595 [Theileria annulata]|uniref:Uncharacterized protein n=1 Tax=Theileria annulata TaxID=5874 RepID=Q4UDK5_THEAN|nr:uncharacterized protein TA11595 [Theileria annulata]CAI74834.1 hypothetical protein TA11595 [Theileria annulata]|eukprot:XP_952566.1 hypothetical protein TA11595 [Theileria annulata]
MYNVYMLLIPRDSVLRTSLRITSTNFPQTIFLNKKFIAKTFSTLSDQCSTDLGRIRSSLSSLHDDLTFLASSSIKSGCQNLELRYKDPSNSSLNSRLSSMNKCGSEIEKVVYKILDNRVRYNMARNKRVARDANYKFGILGVSLICVFGSLSISLHPLFLIGCGVGAYFYRVVYRQSRLRKGRHIKIQNILQ